MYVWHGTCIVDEVSSEMASRRTRFFSSDAIDFSRAEEDDGDASSTVSPIRSSPTPSSPSVDDDSKAEDILFSAARAFACCGLTSKHF